MNGTGGRRASTVDPELPDRVAELEARLEQLESEARLLPRGRSLMYKVMPPEASRHFRNAGREQLLGMRAIVDFWLRRLDEAEERASVTPGHAEPIELE